jgi:hypothetical protein
VQVFWVQMACFLKNSHSPPPVGYCCFEIEVTTNQKYQAKSDSHQNAKFG